MLEIELIVGTMGLDNIYGGKLPRYSEALLKRSSDVLKEFEQTAKSITRSRHTGKMPSETYKFKDFRRLIDMLTKDQEILSAAEGLGSWPSDLQVALVTQIADVKAYLQQQIPQSLMVGTLSSSAVEPSDSDKFRFLWQANLCDDIKRFAELFSAGAITPIESQLMRVLFPEAHDFFVILVMDQVINAVAEGDEDSLEGGWQKSAISGLLNVPIMSFTDVMQYQTGMVEKTAGRPKGPGAVQIAKYNLSDTQKLETDTLDLSK